MGKNFSNLLYWVWLCILVSWHSPLRAECPVTSTGLCTPGVEETIVIDEVETIEYEADGYTVTTETTTTTTTVTTTNPDSGDILMEMLVMFHHQNMKVIWIWTGEAKVQQVCRLEILVII